MDFTIIIHRDSVREMKNFRKGAHIAGLDRPAMCAACTDKEKIPTSPTSALDCPMIHGSRGNTGDEEAPPL